MNPVNATLELLEAGGDVLWLILLVSICLWSLVCERLIYFRVVYPKLQGDYMQKWAKQRENRGLKEKFHIKKYLMSEARISMEKSLAIIKMLIAICPMLGLLGTVVGMIHVFYVMAVTVTVTGAARSMAAGISQATISTMAGMIVAISGLYFHQLIKKRVDDNIHQLGLLRLF